MAHEPSETTEYPEQDLAPNSTETSKAESTTEPEIIAVGEAVDRSIPECPESMKPVLAALLVLHDPQASATAKKTAYRDLDLSMKNKDIDPGIIELLKEIEESLDKQTIENTELAVSEEEWNQVNELLRIKQKYGTEIPAKTEFMKQLEYMHDSVIGLKSISDSKRYLSMIALKDIENDPHLPEEIIKALSIIYETASESFIPRHVPVKQFTDDEIDPFFEALENQKDRIKEVVTENIENHMLFRFLVKLQGKRLEKALKDAAN